MLYLQRRLTVAITVAVAAFLCLEVLAGAGLESPMRMITELLVLAAAAFVAAAFGTPATADGAMSMAAARADVTEAFDRETGTVKWFNVQKGYGFIVRDQGDDVFVHYRNIVGQGRRSIAEGQRVSFSVVNGDKGPQADQVEPV